MGKKAVNAKYAVFCCGGGDCIKRGAKDVMKAMRAELKEQGMKGDVAITKTHCNGMCKAGPILVVCSGGCVHGGCGKECGIVWYEKLDEKDARKIVTSHLRDGVALESKRKSELIQIEVPEE
ncbi:MAG TPA: (2Fe-2S) ferredoxin domain-containing protein [Abditibacteriaceae bacterium]|jgi:(2Fe-2S) ferredoxin